MTETTVVNLRKDNYEVYIGRGSKWGNKFVIGKDGGREEVIKKYKEWVMNSDILTTLKSGASKRNLTAQFRSVCSS